MTSLAAAEGAAAFDIGAARSTNPYDPNSKDWDHWRDGWDQAKAAADIDARADADPAGERAAVPAPLRIEAESPLAP